MRARRPLCMPASFLFKRPGEREPSPNWKRESYQYLLTIYLLKKASHAYSWHPEGNSQRLSRDGISGIGLAWPNVGFRLLGAFCMAISRWPFDCLRMRLSSAALVWCALQRSYESLRAMYALLTQGSSLFQNSLISYAFTGFFTFSEHVERRNVNTAFVASTLIAPG